MKIYTRTGDAGDTGLLGGGRVPKDHARVAAYGAVDELNAVIGMALAAEPADFERTLLLAVQRDLFAIGGRLAAPHPEKVEKALAKTVIPDERVGELEQAIDRADDGLAPLKAFVLPGGSPKGAALHFARTVCRRAERDVVRLSRDDDVPGVILVYLNRLSDLLFTLARLANHRAGVADERW